MEIEHVDKYGPNFQWLRALDDEGQSSFGSVGVALPGHYDFPPSKNGETITVLSGRMTINGKNCTASDRTAVIKVGESVHIWVHEPSRYMANHGV